MAHLRSEIPRSASFERIRFGVDFITAVIDDAQSFYGEPEQMQEKFTASTEDFAARLKALMVRGRFKLRHLAEVCGVSVSTAGGWTSGRHMPDYDTVERIAEFLGVSAKYLYRGEPDSGDSGSRYGFTQKITKVEEGSAPMIRPSDDYPPPVDDPTPRKCVEYFQRYIEEARKVPGGIGYTWIQLQQHFSFDLLERMKGNTKQEETDE